MQVLIRLFKYVKPSKLLLITALIMLIFGVFFDLLAPWLLRQSIDLGMSKGSMPTVILFTLLLFGGQLVKCVAMYVQGITQEKVGQNVVFDMRQQLYEHLQRLSFSYYDKAQTGQIMSKMTGDIEAVKNFLGFGAIMIINGMLTLVGTLAFMLYLQWQVTLISMITVPLIILSLYQFNNKVGPAWGNIREQMGRLTSTLQENISGIRVVKAFARETTEKQKFGERNEQNFESNMNRAQLEAKSFPLMGLYGGIIFLLTVWIGGIYVANGQMSIGTLVAFQWYAWGIIWPLNMLGWLINIMQQAIKAAPRVFEILDTPVSIASPPQHGRVLSQKKGLVIFDHVSFQFTGSSDPEKENGKRNILSNINLRVEPGEVIAILGATGCGKSSLIYLISRFYDVSAGSISIDGHDVRDYDLDELRKMVGIVPQETFLFSATISENIAYGHPEATAEQIHWAARKAQIHDFITSQPDGYDTIIGERGVGLSGGQRQRVALARAILMDPPVLVLDEATASVDTATESAIHEGLHEVMQGKTTFIVAQRLSSIQRADRIIVLHEGHIVEEGTHKELNDKDGFFRKLFLMQQIEDVGVTERMAITKGGDNL